MRNRLTLLTALLLTPLAALHAADQSAARLLPLTSESASQLERAQKAGLIEIAPVHLPPSDAGDCNHYGWPVATMTGGAIIVMHRRIPGHKATGAGKPDPTMSYGIVLRSEDGGKSWSRPYDLRDCMKPEDRERGGLVPLSHRAKFDKENKAEEGFKVHLHSIGTTRNGAVVAINNHGVFRSDDEGRTWTHFSTALREDTFPHEIVNLGPRLIDHPRQGLLAFGNWFGEVDKYHALRQQLVVLRSTDGGSHWVVEEHAAGFPQYEPAALMHEGRFLFVTRDQTKVRAHKQVSWRPGQPPRVIDTNLEDLRLVDTVDFSFNPVTKRFEVVRSERHRMELWLWSMDPAEWDQGQWKRECRLVATEGKFYSTADGFHPAGAVLDEKRGVQHVFIYSGHPNGPAGVFRITRTLDTVKLSAALAALNAADSSPSEAAKLPAFQGPTPGVNREIDMPLVDLSREKERHAVVAAGTESVYQGHCDTVMLPDGKTMFTAWCLGHARWIGPIAKSTDAGRTWSKPLDVPGNWKATSNTPVLHRLIAPDGTARLFCFADGLDWSRQGKPPYPMHQAYSEDNGQTWTPMIPNGVEGEVPPKTIHAFDQGKRLVMWSDLPGYVVQSESLDGGLTWSPSRSILRVPGRWSQPCVIRSADGRTHLMLLRENSREYQSLYSVSHDDAKTWTTPRELPATLAGDRHVAKFTPDGRLVVAFRDVAKSSPTYGHYLAWVGRFENILEGKPGDYRVKLFHNALRKEMDKPGAGNADCGYSDLELLPDGTIVATTYLKYAEGPEKHSVMNTRFKLAETDALLR